MRRSCDVGEEQSTSIAGWMDESSISIAGWMDNSVKEQSGRNSLGWQSSRQFVIGGGALAACANAVLLEEASVDRPGWWCLEEWPDGSLSDMPKSPERGVPCMPGPVCSSKLAWRASCSVGQSSSSSGGGTALCFSERGAGGRGVRWGCWGVSCVSPGDWDWGGGWEKSCVTPGGGGGGGWRPKVAQKVGSWGLRMGGCGTLGLGGRLCMP